MSRFNRISCSLIAITTIFSLPFYLPLVGQALQPSSRETHLTQASSKPDFDEFVRLEGRPDRNRVGRDGEICTIAPLPRDIEGKQISNQFLSNRPIFVWRGAAKQIQVRSVRDERVIWETNLTGKEEWAAFNSLQEKLMPAQLYEVILIGTNGKSSEMSFTVAGDERAQERAELKQQINKIPKNHRTPGAIALQQAIYLGQKKLWLDAYGILFSTQQKLTVGEQKNWKNGLQTIRQSICPEKREKSLLRDY